MISVFKLPHVCCVCSDGTVMKSCWRMMVDCQAFSLQERLVWLYW